MGAVKLWQCTVLLAGLGAAPAMAQAAGQGPLDPDAALALSEAAIGTEVGDYVLIDSRGEELALATLRGRPLVISLVYTSCSSVCPATTQHLIDMVGEARQVFGQDAFSVLSVGFDARNDTPARLRAFAATQGIDHRAWRLATADSATLAGLLDDLGFSYTEAAGGFLHVTQTTILDAEGRVYRQVYGDAFPSQVFLEPLKELIYGTSARFDSVEDVIDRIRFLCTVYNPSTGAYSFEYAYFIGMGIGGVSLVITGLIVYRLWRSNRRLVAAHRAEQAR
jgi:protein SCO1/2